MEVLMTASRPLWVRILTIITSPLFAASGLYLLFVAVAGKSILVGVGGCAMLILGVISPILSWRYRLILTESGITEIAAITRTIEYQSISKAVIRYGKLTLSSVENNISITKDITDREQVLTLVAKRLASCTNIVYDGDKEDLETYFGIKSES